MSRRYCPTCHSALTHIIVVLPATLRMDMRVDVNDGRFARIDDPVLSTEPVSYLDNRDQQLEKTAAGHCPECGSVSPLSQYELRTNCLVCGTYEPNVVLLCGWSYQHLCKTCYSLMLAKRCDRCEYADKCVMKKEFGDNHVDARN